jgi:hypothetical protein
MRAQWDAELIGDACIKGAMGAPCLQLVCLSVNRLSRRPI